MLNPIIRIKGNPITVGQARELIYRTCPYFTNFGDPTDDVDAELAYHYQQRAGKQLLLDFIAKLDSNPLNQSRWLVITTDTIRMRTAFVGTQYASNNWGSNNSGGWCDCGGTVVGSSEVDRDSYDLRTIVSDWQLIAQAFDFLHAELTINDGIYIHYCLIDKGKLSIVESVATEWQMGTQQHIQLSDLNLYADSTLAQLELAIPEIIRQGLYENLISDTTYHKFIHQNFPLF